MDDLTRTIEEINGNPLDPEERASVELWEKGRQLEYQVRAPGWLSVLEILQSYVTNEIRAMLSTDPSKRDDVLASHAVAFAANRIFENFQTDVQSAIEASRQTPEAVKRGLRNSPCPVESI